MFNGLGKELAANVYDNNFLYISMLEISINIKNVVIYFKVRSAVDEVEIGFK